MAEQVRASHLLIKHKGSRRPASRLSDNITRSKEEAIQQLLELRSQIVSGQAKFEDLAKQFSDCNSGTRGGDLGPFGRGMMQKPFEDATFALKIP
ncbi:peptidyl-prolyl cis-trans isomerase nima-interacting 1-like [Plasmopara halstedii]|uniref:Peptidyl-prolyl cis-trans isomerase n=1 Tax=Plasmopara halstedii TaxID=4781 RepID=A0A0P1B0R7_PLAHL|nr:peptidyl-prolyl cis-trans isomerase nima-interacting 1-like [Plasmopara halstedii]CEG46808.1 peptidyl-prolyl cis-trans isomerase nima-interacting 1-like [Plasmopara halstedii]|eukprot:XP_024583177.1 peptidyl-prolyl cis-trans isomerase nima-interacting 1-like [Plasmopara halstedii]